MSDAYETKRSPRGSVVVSGDRLVTDEVTTAKANVLATWLNRNILNEEQLESFIWSTSDMP